MAWRTRSSRRGFGGSGAPLSWHTHGTRPPAGSVEWWPRGLASRMAMSWRATYGIGTRPRKAPNRIHRTDAIALGPDCGRPPKEADNRPVLMADVRQRFRSGTRAAYPPAGGCKPAI